MSGPLGGEGFTLGKPALQQVSEVVRAFNAGGGAGTGGKNPYRPGWNPGGMEGVVVNGITAATVANNGQITYGSGSAMIVIPVTANNGAIVAQNDSAYGVQKIINFSVNSNTVATNTHIGVVWRNGFLSLDWLDC